MDVGEMEMDTDSEQIIARVFIDAKQRPYWRNEISPSPLQRYWDPVAWPLIRTLLSTCQRHAMRRKVIPSIPRTFSTVHPV